MVYTAVHWYTGRVARMVKPWCTVPVYQVHQCTKLQWGWCNYSVTAIYWAAGPQGKQQGAPLQFTLTVFLSSIVIIIIVVIIIVISSVIIVVIIVLHEMS